MTAEAIARVTNVPIDLVTTAIAELSKPDPLSRTPDCDGRRLVLIDKHRSWGWKIVNYRHYLKITDERTRREYMRTYMRDYRAKDEDGKQDVNSVNSGKPVLASESESESESEAEKKNEKKAGVLPAAPNGNNGDKPPEPDGEQQFAEALVAHRPYIIFSAGPKEVAQLRACIAAHGVDALLDVVVDAEVKTANVWGLFNEVEARAKAKANKKRYGKPKRPVDNLPILT
jgi:hypothetical protein